MVTIVIINVRLAKKLDPMNYLKRCLSAGFMLWIGLLSIVHAFDAEKTKDLKTYLDGIVRTHSDYILNLDKIEFKARCKRLIIEGADPNTSTDPALLGISPLHLAIDIDDSDLISFLFEYGADIERKSTSEKTPLLWAAWKGKANAVIKLCSLGANIEVRDKSNFSALMLAAHSTSEKAMESLINFGEDIHYTIRYGVGEWGYNQSALNIARAEPRILLETYLSQDNDLRGEGVFHKALRFNHKTSIKPILDSHAPHKLFSSFVNQLDSQKQTPLYMALVVRNQQAIIELLDHGANPLLGRQNSLLLAKRVSEFNMGPGISIYDRVYHAAKIQYLLILLLSPEFAALPKDVVKYILRLVLNSHLEVTWEEEILKVSK